MSSASSIRTLDQIGTGSRAVVKSIGSSNPSLANRLVAMGIVAGTTIEVMPPAPLGDPIRIKALGYVLTLRLSEAKSVEVQDL